ncbi:MAG: hypothetical protein ACRDZQ_11435 [Acidimicrobiales bacterium]
MIARPSAERDLDPTWLGRLLDAVGLAATVLVALAIAAGAVAGLLVRRQFFPVASAPFQSVARLLVTGIDLAVAVVLVVGVSSVALARACFWTSRSRAGTAALGLASVAGPLLIAGAGLAIWQVAASGALPAGEAVTEAADNAVTALLGAVAAGVAIVSSRT